MGTRAIMMKASTLLSIMLAPTAAINVRAHLARLCMPSPFALAETGLARAVTEKEQSITMRAADPVTDGLGVSSTVAQSPLRGGRSAIPLMVPRPTLEGEWLAHTMAAMEQQPRSKTLH